jgi:nickel-dependent lactate racemase
MRITLNQEPWHKNNTIEIELPDEWQATYCPMTGIDDAALTISEMEEAIKAPIGTPSLVEMAKGKKRVVILFDDMTRPTKIYEIAPIILKELHEAGLKEDQITFVCALGTHGAITMADFRKKLGSKIVERYRVFNHVVFENCDYIGTTKMGTKMMINREVARADLTIAIG